VYGEGKRNPNGLRQQKANALSEVNTCRRRERDVAYRGERGSGERNGPSLMQLKQKAKK